MSWVFLTDERAYKLKKPVCYDYLDFSTIDRRRHFCAEEVRLNRRLAPGVYLRIVPLSIGPGNRLRLGKNGVVVDWLVEMRRLPSDATLEAAIRRGDVRENDVRRIVETLVAFYSRSPRIAVDPDAYRARLTDDIEANRSALVLAAAHLDNEAVEAVAHGLARYLVDGRALLDRRVHEGRIVEGHGDLRPEHVYLGPEPIVTDCLEFNSELRIVDPVDELAFLAMECTHIGAPQVEAWIFDAYRRAMKDDPTPELIAFYKASRAYLRARLAIGHLGEGAQDEPKWIGRARDYLALARRAAAALPSAGERSL